MERDDVAISTWWYYRGRGSRSFVKDVDTPSKRRPSRAFALHSRWFQLELHHLKPNRSIHERFQLRLIYFEHVKCHVRISTHGGHIIVERERNVTYVTIVVISCVFLISLIHQQGLWVECILWLHLVPSFFFCEFCLAFHSSFVSRSSFVRLDLIFSSFRITLLFPTFNRKPSLMEMREWNQKKKKL